MIRYLIQPDAATARSRSAAAWAALSPPASSTVAGLWTIEERPAAGLVALAIPDTPEEAQIGLSQAAYDALLTEAERATLVDDLPADWGPADE